MDWIASTRRSLVEKNLFLDVRRQVKQPRDLSDPCCRHMTQSCQLSIVLNGAGADQCVEADGQRHQASDAPYAATRRRRRWWLGADAKLLVCAAANTREMNVILDRE